MPRNRYNHSLRAQGSRSAPDQFTLRVGIVLALVTCVLAVSVAPVLAEDESDAQAPTREYFAYICAESEDEVSLIQFGPGGAEIAKTIEVGSFPAEIEGPHGINVSPSGRYWYVSVSHGQPFGTIHKYSTGTDEWEGDVRVGMFPATLDVSMSTGLLYVVNSDFYGDHVPSTISVIETSTMTEIEQISTGTMPHGARLDGKGSMLYSVNMMDDELVEVDGLRFEITRRLALGEMKHGSGDHSMHGSGHGPMVEPSWVTAPTARGKVYVAALSGNQIIEVDLDSWKVSRRFDTPAGPYNVDVSPDGNLLAVTYKKADAVGFWDLDQGKEIKRIETTRRIPHGIVITADGRYTFATVEGVGGEPGSVEIYDNQALVRVAVVDVGKQAGGIALWERSGP